MNPSKIDTKIDWLGEVPREWARCRLKTTIKESLNGVWGDEPGDDENDLICIRVVDFNYDNLTINKNKYTLRNIPENQQKRMLKKGDILIEKSGGGEKQPVGRAIIYENKIGKAVCSNFIGKITLYKAKVIPKFVVYYLSSLYSKGINTKHIKQTTGIQNLDLESYLNEYIYLPLLTEQQKLADFLDQKCAMIDSLIEKKQKLVELKKEEQTALINQAVTKGLDPNVPMKDSGIEWLGEIPEHWEVKKIKHIAFLKSGEGIKSEQIDKLGNYPVFGGNGLRGYYSDYTHEGEFVLIGRQGALCGNINYVSGKFWASEHAVVVDLSPSYFIMWVGELLRSMNLNQYSISAAQPGLSVERISNIKIPVPTFDEQKQMANYFKRVNNNYNSIITKFETEMALLKEYKIALISEAVTGKLCL